MTHIQWNEAFEVGFKTIDDQHKVLVRIINELYDAQKHGTIREIMNETLDKLHDYTIYHFDAEKELFLEYKYPDMEEHLKEHDYFVNELRRLQSEFRNGNILLSLKTMDFLKDWTISHILGSDKAFGDFIKFKELGL